MLKSNELAVVAGIIVDLKGRVLICKRPGADQGDIGTWEFPGGKIEEGETHIEALKREIAEELELEIQVLDSVGQVTAEKSHKALIRLTAYNAKVVQSDKLVLREHTNYKWLFIEDIEIESLLPLDQQLVRKFLKLR